MTHLGRLLSAGALFIGLALPAAVHADKVGVVNMQRAIEETAEGKAALSKLKAEVERKQKELEQKRDELKKLNDELEKQASVMKAETLEKRKQELGQKMAQWQEAAMRSQREISEKEAKATQPIVDKLLRAIDAIANRDKFSLVVRQEVVLWPHSAAMDITNEVIRKANEMK